MDSLDQNEAGMIGGDTTVDVPGSADSEKPKPVKSDTVRSRLVSVVINAILTAALIAAYHLYCVKPSVPKIVHVDVRGFIAAQQELFVANEASKGQIEENFNKLDGAIKSIPADTIVLFSDAVVQGGKKIEF